MGDWHYGFPLLFRFLLSNFQRNIHQSLMKSNMKQQDTSFQDRQVCRESIKKCTNPIHYHISHKEGRQSNVSREEALDWEVSSVSKPGVEGLMGYCGKFHYLLGVLRIFVLHYFLALTSLIPYDTNVFIT